MDKSLELEEESMAGINISMDEESLSLQVTNGKVYRILQKIVLLALCIVLGANAETIKYLIV